MSIRVPSQESTRRAALVEPASEYPSLDPFVQSFVDRWEEGAPNLLKAETVPSALNLEPGWVLLRPFGQTSPLHVLIYLEVASDVCEDRTSALQALADHAGVAVLKHSIPANAVRQSSRTALWKKAERIAAANHLVFDDGRVAIGGDGLGAAEALALATDRTVSAHPLRLLVLATPVLGAPSLTPGTTWMPPARAAMLAEAVVPIVDFDGLVTDRLPPVLILTAEADPFRDGAEAMARRLMAEGLEVSAVRILGTIHDFTWLPTLRDAPGSIDACRLIADALRRHLCPHTTQEFPS